MITILAIYILSTLSPLKGVLMVFSFFGLFLSVLQDIAIFSLLKRERNKELD